VSKIRGKVWYFNSVLQLGIAIIGIQYTCTTVSVTLKTF